MRLQEIINNTDKGVKVHYKNPCNDVMYVCKHQKGYYYIYNENYCIHPMCTAFIDNNELIPFFKEDDFYLKTVEDVKPTLEEYINKRIEELTFDGTTDNVEFLCNSREKKVLRFIRDYYL